MGKKAIAAVPQLAPGACPPRHADATPQTRATLADAAAHGLARAMPALSAHIVITAPQVAAFSLTLAASLASAILWPDAAWGALIALLSFGFLAGTLFRAGLACLGGLPWPAQEPRLLRAPPPRSECLDARAQPLRKPCAREAAPAGEGGDLGGHSLGLPTDPGRMGGTR